MSTLELSCWTGTLAGAIRIVEPEHYTLRDMTPAQIARKYGATVADYIVELRHDEDTWRRLFAEARDGESEDKPSESRNAD